MSLTQQQMSLNDNYGDKSTKDTFPMMMTRHKKDNAPRGAGKQSHEFSQEAFLSCPDSPPSLSLASSSKGMRTTGEKGHTRESKMAGKDGNAVKVNLIFRCISCGKQHSENFIPYNFDNNYGNCEACGNF
jgi:hypothetical protein